MNRIIMGIVIMLLFCPAFASASLDEVNKDQIIKKAYRLHVPFVENKGQVENNEVRFYAKTFGGTLFVEKDGTLTYSLPSGDKEGVVIRETFTDTKVKVEGSGPSPTRVNYFKGNDRDKWRTDIPSYESVSLREIYKGIDLTLKAYGNNVEKLYTVLPKANPEAIKSEMRGANELRVNDKGELEVITDHGTLTFTRPRAYQEIEGKQVEVEVRYNILNSQHQTPNAHSPSHPLTLAYGFTTGSYDTSRPLVIDPLLASTFLGDLSESHSIAFDDDGNIFITGETSSSDYPTTPGAYDEIFTGINGYGDVFVSKLDSDLSSLLASTFLGGNKDDIGRSITLDDSGNVYVTGETASLNYPTTPGAYDEIYNGGSGYDPTDVFVSKLDNSLSNLLASTFIGGANQSEYGYSIAIDDSGSVFIAGGTYSSDFPATSGAYDESHNGYYDAFVSKFDSSLQSLLASTFIGGSGYDKSYGLTLDNIGNVYITGDTSSSDYPSTPDAYDQSCGGYDVFVSKLDNNLHSLLASTFLGGSSEDRAKSLSIDRDGNIYIAGSTSSADYPTTPGAYAEIYNHYYEGYYNGFISKLDSSLQILLASTFLGGSSHDHCYSLALDRAGDVYVTGKTHSADFPTTPDAYDTRYNNGDGDIFFSKLDSNLSLLLSSTFIGGSKGDDASSLALYKNESIYITGRTLSLDYPTTSGAYNELHSGHWDSFVSWLAIKFDLTANGSCQWDNDFYLGETVYGSAVLNLSPHTAYPIFIVDSASWTDGMAIPTSCTHCMTSPETSITTDESGNLDCGTVIWQNAQSDVLPGYFDMIIDVNNNGIYDAGVDFLDSNTSEGFEVCLDTDRDGICDDEDNCGDVANGPSRGTCTEGKIGYACTMPSENNSECGPGGYCSMNQEDEDNDGIGDACKPYDQVLPPAVDGHYNYVFQRCDDQTSETSGIEDTIQVSYSSWFMIGGKCQYLGFIYEKRGLVEFDIADLHNLFARGQVRADLIFNIKGGELTEDRCLYFYNLQDQHENGIIEESDVNPVNQIGTICTELLTGETITLDVTSSLEHDLFDPGQTNYSGFMIKSMNGVSIELFDHTDSVDGPRLSIEYLDIDGDGIAPRDNCPEIPNGFRMGTCTEGSIGGSCLSNGDCGDAGFCSMSQEDDDGDCIGNACDALPYDPQQPDEDNDGIGDVCDECIDTDGDGYGNPGYLMNMCAVDSCPLITNPDQEDNDLDNLGDVCENCPTTFNPLQEDMYPPQGNGIGDACECEGDFECDGDVDGSDASTFKADFGRSIMNQPCIAGDACNGDFSCDGDVDGTDAALFKADFGRSSMQNPCPACMAGEWCGY